MSGDSQRSLFALTADAVEHCYRLPRDPAPPRKPEPPRPPVEPQPPVPPSATIKPIRYADGDWRHAAHSLYRQRHRELGPECPALDVDAIEWRRVDGAWRAIAVLETTSVRHATRLGLADYLETILDRLRGGHADNEHGQLGHLVRIGRALGAPVYVVAYDPPVENLAVYSTRRGAWLHFLWSEYAAWLKALPAPRRIT